MSAPIVSNPIMSATMSAPIRRGKSDPPIRIVIYGPAGCGKSTWACSAPRPLAIDAERGLEQIGVDRVDLPKSWPLTKALIREVSELPDYDTIVIDTADRLEEQAIEEVCTEGKKKNLAAFDWGSGSVALAAKWREFLFDLEKCSKTVIIVAHVAQKTIADPTLGKYDGLRAQLDKATWGITARWADGVFLAHYERGLVEGRAVYTGARVLHTQAGTGFEAKSRWDIPAVLPLRWDDFAAARSASVRALDEIRTSIRRLAPQADEAYLAGADARSLAATEKALLNKQVSTNGK